MVAKKLGVIPRWTTICEVFYSVFGMSEELAELSPDLE